MSPGRFDVVCLLGDVKSYGINNPLIFFSKIQLCYTHFYMYFVFGCIVENDSLLFKELARNIPTGTQIERTAKGRMVGRTVLF